MLSVICNKCSKSCWTFLLKIFVVFDSYKEYWNIYKVDVGKKSLENFSFWNRQKITNGTIEVSKLIDFVAVSYKAPVPIFTLYESR